MLRQKMHLWITEESKKTRICKNGFVYSVKDLECSKSKHRKEDSLCDPQECEDNKNILCQCSQKCNLNECYNSKIIYDDGCECRDPKVRTIWNFSSALLHFCIYERLKKCTFLDFNWHFSTVVVGLLRDHLYITSSHFLGFWTPLPPYVSMFLVLRISKNWHFLTQYKCWRNMWIVP